MSAGQAEGWEELNAGMFVSKRRSKPPVFFVQVDQDVHILLGHQLVGGADVMVLQHRPVIVQDGDLRPDGWIKLFRFHRPQMQHACLIGSNFRDCYQETTHPDDS